MRFRQAAAGAVLSIMLVAPALAQPIVPIRPVPDEAFHPVPDPTAPLVTLAPTGSPSVIVDLHSPVQPVPTRPAVAVPTSPVIRVDAPPTQRPVAGVRSTGRSISGAASWYCQAGRSICAAGYPDTAGFDAYAAAGPWLRIALGGAAAADAPQPWKGRTVIVNGIRVKLIDWCQCLWHTADEKVIDLYHDVFSQTGGSVTISW